MAGWWEWGRARQQKRLRKIEKGKRSREFAENTIKWDLPDPVYARWRVKVSITQSFVYVLKETGNNSIRYVGLTDDPPRRHMEHRRNNVLNGKFEMIVVAIGDQDTEREWIARCLEEGCDLLNIIGYPSPNGA